MSRSLRLLAVASIALCAPSALAASESLESCRNLEREFDYKGMLTECGVAAAEPHTTKEERIEIYRLLGIAHATLGEEDKARVWFLKLLTLQPDFTLPSDASPKFRETFAEAQAVFTQEGAVAVAHAPPAIDDTGRPGQVVFDVTDKLGRVGQAKVRVQAIVDGKESSPVEAALLRQDGGQATARYAGDLPDPVLADPRLAPAQYTLRYTLVLQTPAGDVVDPVEPFAPVELAVRGPETAGGGEVPWVWIGAGTAAAVLVAGAVTAGGVSWCLALGPCREPELRISWVKVSVAQGGAE